MNREERTEWAKRKAAETAPERARQRQLEESERSARIASMGSAEANRLARSLDNDPSIPWLGPIATPYEWSEAVAAARAVAIEAARRGQLITYGELRVAAVHATQMKVGHSQYAELAMSINRTADKCLLSAIVVGASTGVPGAGFLPFARAEGFNDPLESLQRQVFEQFGSRS